MIDKKYRLTRLLYVAVLGMFIACRLSLIVYAEELPPAVNESEKAHLQEYFKDYYYKQGMDSLKFSRYEEAIAKFKRALYWDSQFEAATRAIKLAENKIAWQRKLEEQKKQEEERRTAQQKSLEEQKKRAEEERIARQKMLEERKKREAEEKFAQQKLVEEQKREAQERNFGLQRKREEEKMREQEEKSQAQEAQKQKIEQARQKKELFKKLTEEEAAAVEKLMAPEISFSEAPPSTVIYRIDKEDVLDVAVWRHPELSRETIVRPDGMISYPLVGDIEAAGLTVPELSKKITTGLSEFAKKRLKPSISNKAEEKARYQIANGDTLDVSVWRVPDLSREVIVRPDGMISYPLIGDTQATGKTLTELDEALTKGLGNYVKDPQVSVMVKSFGWNKEAPVALLEENPEVTVMLKKFGGRKVVVLGEVAKPGVYTFTADVRLIEALALAGGYTKYAVKDNILIIRGDVHKSPQVIVSNTSRLLKRADLSQNILIQSQDTVFVPRSIIGNINAFLETISPIIDTIYKGSVIQSISGGN